MMTLSAELHSANSMLTFSLTSEHLSNKPKFNGREPEFEPYTLNMFKLFKSVKSASKTNKAHSLDPEPRSLKC